MYGSLLADLSLRQGLDILTKGLAAEVAISYDNIGGMNETSSKEYRYMNSYASITDDGHLSDHSGDLWKRLRNVGTQPTVRKFIDAQ